MGLLSTAAPLALRQMSWPTRCRHNRKAEWYVSMLAQITRFIGARPDRLLRRPGKREWRLILVTRSLRVPPGHQQNFC